MMSPARQNAASDSFNEIATVRIELRHGVDPPIAVGRQLGDDRLDLGHQFVVR